MPKCPLCWITVIEQKPQISYVLTVYCVCVGSAACGKEERVRNISVYVTLISVKSNRQFGWQSKLV